MPTQSTFFFYICRTNTGFLFSVYTEMYFPFFLIFPEVLYIPLCLAVQHNLFITEITQTPIIFYTDFFGSIYRTDKRTLPFQHKITPCIFYIPMREKKKIELLICRFGVDEKRKTTLSHLLCSRCV